MRMTPRDIPPTSEAWLARIDAAARAEFGRDDLAGEALAAAVRGVSEAYRRQHGSPASLISDRATLCARLRFFLPRDLPKIQAPLAELAAVSALPSAPVLRVLDVGAGLGTTGLGAAAFLLEQAGATRVEIDAFDRDPAALAIAARLAALAAPAFSGQLALRAHHAPLGDALLARARPPYHLVLLGFVLNEIGDVEAGAQSDVVAHHHRWLARLCELLAPDGALIALEPALRAQSRTLQEVRGRFASADGPPYVFAPCLHRGACPLLERERDWCHEQQPLALPPAIAATARAAGLRAAELSYSYLTLHRAPRSLRELDRDPSARLYRVTSSALASKGKIELALCGAGPARKLRRLDRRRDDDNRALDDARRGDVLDVSGAAEAGANGVLDVASALRVTRILRLVEPG
jgi:ribosomal protein RSM22 (predicted rRNA methylase)